MRARDVALLSVLVLSGTGSGQPLGVRAFAGGPPAEGAVDGPPEVARFKHPSGLAVDPSGRLFVADQGNSTIRVIEPDGSVSTFAGVAGIAGSADGSGPSATFRFPEGLALTSCGDLVVTDTVNHLVRRIDPTGRVSTLTGQSGRSGSADGPPGTATLAWPTAIALDSVGNAYLVEGNGGEVRRVSPLGAVTTLRSPDETRYDFYGSEGIAVSGNGTVFVSDVVHTISRIDVDGSLSVLAGASREPGFKDGKGSEARFNHPAGVCVDARGDLVVADAGNNVIRRVTPQGDVTTAAGIPGIAGYRDGPAAEALLKYPWSVACGVAGDVFVGERSDNRIRRISRDGMVTTLAGRPWTTTPLDPDALVSPTGLATGPDGSVFVADFFAIRRVTPAGVSSLFAGQPNLGGHVDGPALQARFEYISDVAVDDAGNVFVADAGDHTLRRISVDGAVSTMAGKSGVPGSTDGSGGEARFNQPLSVLWDPRGFLWVADLFSIRRVSPSGEVSLVAGDPDHGGDTDGVGRAAGFFGPHGLALAPGGDLIVADTGGQTIRRVDAGSRVRTIAGGARVAGSIDGASRGARFNAPRGVVVDRRGRILVADSGNHTIRAIDASGRVTTVAGLAGTPGRVDSAGASARLSTPTDLAIGPAGDVYVSEPSMKSIRRLVEDVDEPPATPGPGAGSLEIVEASPEGAPCPGDSVVLEASPGFVEYLWSTGETSRVVTITAKTARLITVWARDPEHCVTQSASRIVQTVAPTQYPSLLLESCGSMEGVVAAIGWSAGSAPPRSFQWGFRATPQDPVTPIPGRTERTYTIDRADFPDTGAYDLACVIQPACGTAVTLAGPWVHLPSQLAGKAESLLPVPLLGRGDLSGADLALVNRGTGPVAYAVSFAGATEPGLSGRLEAGSQRVETDILSRLPRSGVPGSVSVRFEGVTSLAALSATLRVRSQEGASAVAVGPSPGCPGQARALVVPGLVSNERERSHVILVNPNPEPTVVALSVLSADATDGASRTMLVPLPPLGRVELEDVLDDAGLTSGWVLVEPPSTGVEIFGLVEDRITGRLTHVPGIETRGSTTRSLPSDGGIVPVLVSTESLSSELVLVNPSRYGFKVELDYRESLPSGRGSGPIPVALGPHEQLTLPLVQELLDPAGTPSGQRGPRVGTLRYRASSGVVAVVRLIERSTGNVTLVVPGTDSILAATSFAWLPALRSGDGIRTNVALVNGGADEDGPVDLEVAVRDGDAAGARVEDPIPVWLAPGGWTQLDDLLRTRGVTNGWVEVTRRSGRAPWLTYAIVHDKRADATRESVELIPMRR